MAVTKVHGIPSDNGSGAIANAENSYSASGVFTRGRFVFKNELTGLALSHNHVSGVCGMLRPKQRR